MRRVFVAAALALALTGAARAQSYPPQDAGAERPDFVIFREALRRAAAEHDVEAVIRLSAPTARLSFGGDGGPEGLRRVSQDPDFFIQLQRVLATAAGEDRHGGLAAPYWSVIEHDAGFDPFETWFFAAAQTPLRVEPKLRSETRGSVSFEFVRRPLGSGAGDGAEFVAVELADGRMGSLPRAALMPALGYRAGFEKTPQGWRMTYFLAGD